MDILLVDDEPLSREAVAEFVMELGHRVTQCEDGEKALQLLRQKVFPLVISDIRMPGIDGLQLIEKANDLPQRECIDIILMTGHGDMETAIQALRKGAYDFLRKPIDVEDLVAAIERSAKHQELIWENRTLKRQFEQRIDEVTQETQQKLEQLQSAYAELVGVGRIGIFSSLMNSVIAIAEKFHQERGIPVLIEGETGTGKEVIARLVHYGQQSNTTTPFVSINCSAISANLFESELFGYEGGAFTGSRQSGMMGKFELAQGGTLFLDEIGELPIELQPKLLRVLQEKEIYRIGGIKKIKLDVRIICATNRNLAALTEQNLFRRDLLYRLNMGRIQLPPLRERREAIAPLAQMFLSRYAEDKKRNFKLLHKDAVTILEKHSWPGNVRELQNVIERVVLLYDSVEILPKHLHFLHSDDIDIVDPEESAIRPGHLKLPSDKLDLQELEIEIVQKALKMHDYNKTRTAEYLGMTRSALRSRLRKLSLPSGRFNS